MRKAITLFWLGICSGALAADVSGGERQVQTNGFRFLDLSRFTVSPGADAPVARQFAILPRGLQSFHAIPFLVGERVALTGIESARSGELYAKEIIGIRLGAKARRLHFLHCALFADKDGAPMFKLILHYAGGAEESFRFGYGVHAREWMKPRVEKKSGLVDPNSQLAWAEGDANERGTQFRLFQTALENPRPNEILESIDLISLFSRTTPLIFAISAEQPDSGLPPNRPAAARRMIRELHQLSDSAYRGEFAIRITDAQTGQPLTNAVAGLTVTDDTQAYYFGEAQADARGVCRLTYPPQHTISLG